MARKISSSNIAYKLRRGQPDLLYEPGAEKSEFLSDTLLSTHQMDFKVIFIIIEVAFIEILIKENLLVMIFHVFF